MAEAKSNKCKFVERLELELLSALFTYVVPFVNRKISLKAKEQNSAKNLENIVNQKPKIALQDIKELESLLLKNLKDNVKKSKSVKVSPDGMAYSLGFRRQKSNGEKTGRHSISIQYDESQAGDRFLVSVKENGKEKYFSKIKSQKEARDKIAPYSIKISYEDNYGEERLTITYRQQLKNYLQKHVQGKEDMTNMVPLKWLNILPETMMGGVLGFTYLGENFMGRRADLTGKTARMVDIHESIHTPDEYETRVLTSWIMEKARMKYVK